MPVNEVVEAAYQLEDRVGIALGPVIVNACYPPVRTVGQRRPPRPSAAAGVDARPGAGRRAGGGPRASASAVTSSRRSRSRRLAEELPLPQLRVPYLFTDAIGPLELDTLSQALAAGIEALHEPDRVARDDFAGAAATGPGTGHHRRGRP